MQEQQARTHTSIVHMHCTACRHIQQLQHSPALPGWVGLISIPNHLDVEAFTHKAREVQRCTLLCLDTTVQVVYLHQPPVHIMDCRCLRALSAL